MSKARGAISKARLDKVQYETILDQDLLRNELPSRFPYCQSEEGWQAGNYLKFSSAVDAKGPSFQMWGALQFLLVKLRLSKWVA